MAKLVAFLSSEDAEMINGALVTADGGESTIVLCIILPGLLTDMFTAGITAA